MKIEAPVLIPYESLHAEEGIIEMKPMVIALNGPPQIGKGWLAAKITQLLPVRSRIMSLAAALRDEVFAQTQWEGSYPDFKTHVFSDGETGRDKLITHGQAMRAVNPTYWIDRLILDPRFMDPGIDVIIVDDLGFHNEQSAFMAHSSHFMSIIMAPTQYSIGCIYKGDSRVCLPPIGGYRCIDSNTALQIFKERLSHASAIEPTNRESCGLWFTALMAGHVGELVDS